MGTGTTAASSMGTAGTYMQAAGVIGQTIGAYGKSKADKAGYEYQSVVARNNAQLAEWQAQDALSRGVRTEQNQRLKTAQLKGDQTASLAARGIDLGTGSALNILSDTDFMGARDAELIRFNAANEAWGYRTQGMDYMANSNLLKGRANAESPGGAAYDTLLTGAGSVASSWYKANSVGAYGGSGAPSAGPDATRELAYGR